MVDLAAIHLLRDARTAGFRVELNDDTLSVTGPRGRADILTGIREHKAAIIDAIQHPSTGVQHYAGRLRSGIAWLEACQEKLDARGTQAMNDAFVRNLHLWGDIDEELRRVIPEFRGCPIGGCSEQAPVRCLHCAASATSRTQS